MGVRVERLNRWVWWCGRRGKMLRVRRGRGRDRVGGDGDGMAMSSVGWSGYPTCIRSRNGASSSVPSKCGRVREQQRTR